MRAVLVALLTVFVLGMPGGRLPGHTRTPGGCPVLCCISAETGHPKLPTQRRHCLQGPQLHRTTLLALEGLAPRGNTVR